MTEWLHFHFSLSCIGEGNGNLLQWSCLENPRDGGAWWAVIYGVTQSRTRLKWLNLAKWLWMVTAVMKINDACSLEENLDSVLKSRYITLLTNVCLVSSVQFSRSVVSDSLWPHEPQSTRHPCPSPTSRFHPNPCPLSRWCHPTISSSVIPFCSCTQSFPASGSFQMSQLFVSGGQCIGVSASTSVLPVNTQDWSPLGWTGWITLQSKGLSRAFSNTTVPVYQFFCTQLPL